MSINEYEELLGEFTASDFELITWSSKRKGEKVGEKNGGDVFNVYVSKVEWRRRLGSKEGLRL